MDVDNVRRPTDTFDTPGNLCRSERKPRETKIIVAPVIALRRRIRRPRTLVERWGQDEIDGNSVGRSRLADKAWLDRRMAGQRGDHGQDAQLVENVLIGRHQNADVDTLATECPWQRRRNVGKTASLGEIGELARHEQYLHRRFSPFALVRDRATINVADWDATKERSRRRLRKSRMIHQCTRVGMVAVGDRKQKRPIRSPSCNGILVAWRASDGGLRRYVGRLDRD
jgi:hypothetical protein